MEANFDQKTADDITQTIAQALVNDPKYAGRDWAGISVVAIIGDGVRQLSGYTFDIDGKSQPGTPSNDDIDDLFLELQRATSVDGKTPWVSALFRIKRDGMRFGVEFEYDNPTRWKVNPARMAETIASLR